MTALYGLIMRKYGPASDLAIIDKSEPSSRLGGETKSQLSAVRHNLVHDPNRASYQDNMGQLRVRPQCILRWDMYPESYYVPKNGKDKKTFRWHRFENGTVICMKSMIVCETM
jgi:hypothetical protein